MKELLLRILFVYLIEGISNNNPCTRSTILPFKCNVKIDFDIQAVWWPPILISYYVDRGHPIPSLVHTPATKN
ncbi:hypothetical protein ES332_A10G195300v1 [Gossypium tomentosum]|uniref:Uncharacterized protein n=1 Tax=Gossypium tomentosum TaxID=34277 RepID=A0A5D2NU82_GOSTO|nr:hypothetical protein ES332_A10G195300v1 [Gossypium tomentosum]